MAIACRFSCDRCKLRDVICPVEARAKSMDVISWMNDVVLPTVGRRHHELSPHCRTKQLQDLKIPFDKDDPDGWIGKQTDQVPPEGDAP